MYLLLLIEIRTGHTEADSTLARSVESLGEAAIQPGNTAVLATEPLHLLDKFESLGWWLPKNIEQPTEVIDQCKRIGGKIEAKAVRSFKGERNGSLPRIADIQGTCPARDAVDNLGECLDAESTYLLPTSY